MPGRRGTEKRRLTAKIVTRMSPELAAMIRADAERHGWTDAAYIRYVFTTASAEMPAEDLTKKAQVTARRQELRAPPSPLTIEVTRLRESLGESVGALVQAAIRTREAGDVELHAQIEATIPTMRRLTLEIDKVKRRLLRSDRDRA